jgi:hypothetical protein
MFWSCVYYYILIFIVAIVTYILYGSYRTLLVAISYVERFALFRAPWCDAVDCYFLVFLWVPLFPVFQCPVLLEVRLQLHCVHCCMDFWFFLRGVRFESLAGHWQLWVRFLIVLHNPSAWNSETKKIWEMVFSQKEIWTVVFWVMIRCSVAGVYRCFEGTCRLHLQVISGDGENISGKPSFLSDYMVL